MTTRCAIYTRISRDAVGAGLGVDRQEQDCRELAERLGWRVAAVHRDNDLSAYSGRTRPGYRALLAAVEGGSVDAVVAWHQDRLHRSPAELEEYIRLCEPRSVPTATVRAGELDLTTAAGRMTARIVGAVARHESEQKAERMRRQRQQAQAQGRWIGGARPFGYEADGVTPHPVEGPAVTDAVRRVLAGESLGSIVRQWNADGPLTSTGGRWTTTTLAQVLERPRNAGLVGDRPKGGRLRIVGPASWPALVSEDEWRAFVALRRDPARRTHAGRTSRKLLGSGLYRCGKCGAVLRSGGHGSTGRDRYGCQGTPSCLRRAAEPIDDVVRRAVAELLRRDGVTIATERPDLAPVRSRLDALRVRQEEIASAFAGLELTGPQFRSANARLNDEIQQLEAQLATAAGSDALSALAAGATSAADAFLAADLDRQRAVVDLLATVRVMPLPRGQRFDPATVRIDWRAADDGAQAATA